MNKKIAVAIAAIAIAAILLWCGCKSSLFANAEELAREKPKTDLFETAVSIIKKYETLHKPKHWPLVGYGHKVLPGEKFSRAKALSETEADALLRKDLSKLCAIYRSYGRDSLILATLAYNIGHGAVNRSSIVSKLKQGDREIRESYVAHCRYRGKVHSQIQQRRIEEFENLYVTDQMAAEMEPEKIPLLLQPFLSEAGEIRHDMMLLADVPHPDLINIYEHLDLQESTI